MLPTLKNPIVGYAVGTSIAVIGLYIAFVLPIILRYRAGENFERGAWHLGRHYRWIDPLAILWIALICVLIAVHCSRRHPRQRIVEPLPAPVELDRRQLRTANRRR